MLPTEEIVFRLVLAAVFGAVIGLERERLEWAAGLRTHMLVALGSALVMIVSAFGFADLTSTGYASLDPSRVAAQVVSGIGFLGAGTIILSRQEVVRGLTTAASLWTIAAIGLAVGGGLYLAAACTTGIALVILAIMKPIENRLFGRDRLRKLSLVLEREKAVLSTIESTIESLGLKVEHLGLKRSSSAERDELELTLAQRVPRQRMFETGEKLRAVPGVSEVKF